jgi:hypothetical protein
MIFPPCWCLVTIWHNQQMRVADIACSILHRGKEYLIVIECTIVATRDVRSARLAAQPPPAFDSHNPTMTNIQILEIASGNCGLTESPPCAGQPTETLGVAVQDGAVAAVVFGTKGGGTYFRISGGRRRTQSLSDDARSKRLMSSSRTSCTGSERPVSRPAPA